jgi:hypothetical protein
MKAAALLFGLLGSTALITALPLDPVGRENRLLKDPFTGAPRPSRLDRADPFGRLFKHDHGAVEARDLKSENLKKIKDCKENYCPKWKLNQKACSSACSVPWIDVREKEKAEGKGKFYFIFFSSLFPTDYHLMNWLTTHTLFGLKLDHKPFYDPHNPGNEEARDDGGNGELSEKRSHAVAESTSAPPFNDEEECLERCKASEFSGSCKLNCKKKGKEEREKEEK